MTVIFKAKMEKDKPEITITGNSIEHVLSSNYFEVYTHDGEFEIQLEWMGGNTTLVGVRHVSYDESKFIGWIVEDN